MRIFKFYNKSYVGFICFQRDGLILGHLNSFGQWTNDFGKDQRVLKTNATKEKELLTRRLVVQAADFSKHLPGHQHYYVSYFGHLTRSTPPASSLPATLIYNSIFIFRQWLWPWIKIFRLMWNVLSQNCRVLNAHVDDDACIFFGSWLCNFLFSAHIEVLLNSEAHISSQKFLKFDF